jgi:phosphoribosyl-AMP cyclohydrolase
MSWLDEVRFDADGLVTVIAQDSGTQRVLMVAWANREALAETAASRQAVYWSRSRARLWRKGEESGHHQQIAEIRLDCDGDVVLRCRVAGDRLSIPGAKLLYQQLKERWGDRRPSAEGSELIYRNQR